MKHQHSSQDGQGAPQHAHEHEHGHEHRHEQGSAPHQHLTAANLRPPISLLAMSAWQRLVLAAVVLTVLWAVVLWALQEVA
jgi:ABC-type Zn2+ transport system substrate-binding protein/surface adhesin